MRHRNFKHLFLVTLGTLLVGLISLAGCGGTDGTSSGTNGGGSYNSSSSPPGGSDSYIEVTAEQLVADYTSYAGKNVVLTAEIVSVTDAYIMIGSIKIEPQDKSVLEELFACVTVEVKGQVYDLSDGIVTLINCQIELRGDESI